MNGLRYIRTRCNLSVNELADAIGVSRQAISSWENEKKEIPKQRLEQLERFFGIDKTCFAEITEDQKKYVTNKAMFRYEENGKQTYRYKPQEGVENLSKVYIYFFPEKMYSIDEELANAQKKKHETLTKVDEIIEWTNKAGSVESQICCINRGCNVYSMINQLMDCVKEQKSGERIPLLDEMKSVWKAMMVAYGILDRDTIKLLDKAEFSYGEDGEWILQMADEIRSHWDYRLNAQRDYIKRMKEESNETLEENVGSFADLSIDEAIAYAEGEYRKRIEEIGEESKGVVFCYI